jgi:hypothetical protein
MGWKHRRLQEPPPEEDGVHWSCVGQSVEACWYQKSLLQLQECYDDEDSGA